MRRILDSEEAGLARKAIETAVWLWHPDLSREQPAVVRFHVDFESSGEDLAFHVSADQRFQLFLDGVSMARGPDNGDPGHWPFASYRVALSPGSHALEAEVWWIGDHAPISRMSLRGGFILKAEGVYHERLTTGVACWTVTHLDGYSFTRWDSPHYHAFGDEICLDGRLRDGQQAKLASVLAKAEHYPHTGYYYDKWILSPAVLPEQFSAVRSCGTIRAVAGRMLGPNHAVMPQDTTSAVCLPAQEWLDGKRNLVIPPRSQQSFLCDLDDYCCAYPRLSVSGGRDAVISWGWAEALFYQDHKTKAQRNQVEGLCFIGMTDRFIANGQPGQSYETLWWRAGRYMLISVKTGDAPLTLHPPRVRETRYPLEQAGQFRCDDPRVAAVQEICFRGLQVNSHEHAMDCPYYEQLMYAGDTRIQLLIQYVTSRDDRLAKRCIDLFNWSRARGVLGLTTSRYPDRCTQWIPPFSLYWVWMVHDYFYWRDDAGFVKRQVNGMRSVMNAFSAFLNKDHLLENIPEWTFADWTATWDTGYPPGARNGISSIMNLTYLVTLGKMVELEKRVGDPLMAAAYERQRKLTAAALLRAFWSTERNMMADDDAFQCFSEHAQILVMLSDSLGKAVKRKALKAVLREPGLTKASIYFSHYLFEALFKMQAVETLCARLDGWNKLWEQGFKTPPESFGETRSDCHAWSSHPLYHLHASVLGIQPAEPGFRSVVMRPQDIGWKHIAGKTVHPNGFIESELRFSDSKLEGWVTLPGIGGHLEWRGQKVLLNPGKNIIHIEGHSGGASLEKRNSGSG